MVLMKDDSVTYLLTAKESWVLEEKWPSFFSSLLAMYSTQALKNESIKIEAASNDDDISSITHGNGEAGSIFGILKEKEGRITYECEYCHHCFIDRSHIIQHRRVHTGEKPFKCAICRKSFAAKSSFADHMRRHRGEKPFKCETCHKSFVSKSELNSHTRFHTREKPFRCAICEKAFASNVSLIEHVRRHTGEKPFECKGCKKSFVSRRNLKSHSRNCTCSVASNESKYKDAKTEEERNNLVPNCTSETNSFDTSVDQTSHYSRIAVVDGTKHTDPPRKEKTSYSCDKCSKVFDGRFKLYKHKRWQCNYTAYYSALAAIRNQRIEQS